jgi:hypothetical protein
MKVAVSSKSSAPVYQFTLVPEDRSIHIHSRVIPIADDKLLQQK